MPPSSNKLSSLPCRFAAIIQIYRMAFKPFAIDDNYSKPPYSFLRDMTALGGLKSQALYLDGSSEASFAVKSFLRHSERDAAAPLLFLFVALDLRL
jgi:hypothetical protein